MDGWRCPGCGRCYSPSATRCLYCGPTVQYGSNVSGTMQAVCGHCGTLYTVGGYHISLGPRWSNWGDDSNGLAINGDDQTIAVNSDNQILVTNPADGSGVVLHT